MKKELIEGIDFYFNKEGFIVLTEKYHLEKQYCCGHGCLHCPYDHINVTKKPTPESGNQKHRPS